MEGPGVGMQASTSMPKTVVVCWPAHRIEPDKSILSSVTSILCTVDTKERWQHIHEKIEDLAMRRQGPLMLRLTGHHTMAQIAAPSVQGL